MCISSALQINKDQLLSGTETGIKIWNIHTGICEATLGGEAHDPVMVYILSESKFISTSCSTLNIWNSITLTKEHTFTYDEAIWQVCVSGDKIIVCFYDGKIILTNLQDIILEKRIRRPRQINILLNGDLLVVSHDNVKIWDLNKIICIKTWEQNGTEISICNDTIIISDNHTLKVYS